MPGIDDSCCCAEDSECSPEALAGSSPKRILDFTAGESPAPSEQAPEGAQQQQEPLASDFHGSGAISLEGLRCPVTSSFSMPEQQQAAHLAALGPSDEGKQGLDASAAPARAVGDGHAHGAAQRSSSTGGSEGEGDSGRLREDSQKHLPASASASAQPADLHKVGGCLWPVCVDLSSAALHAPALQLSSPAGHRDENPVMSHETALHCRPCAPTY